MRPVAVLRQVAHEGLGSLDGILRRAGIVFSYVDLFQEVPRSFRVDQLAGLIVLGGPMNVDQADEHPFLLTERQWIHNALEADLPVLGICLGAQLLAKTLGANVYPADKKEIGWFQVRRTPEAADDPLFRHWSEPEYVFQWHGETFDLPRGAVHLAESDDCKHQAFRYGNSVYGMQFHLEMTDPMLQRWLAEPSNCLEIDASDNVDPRDIRQQAEQRLPAASRLGELLFQEFTHVCQDRARN